MKNDGAPKLPRTFEEKETMKRLIVVIEGATLETVRVGKSKDAPYQLLNCDDHQGIIKRHGKEIADYRPDITHQCLLALLDSPLNKAGLLQVYIHTQKNVLIEINPHTRIPRTFKRFCGLFGNILFVGLLVQLLHKLSIRSVNGSEKLLKIIENPITNHLPTKCRKIGLSYDAPVVDINEYVKEIPGDEPVVFFLGGMAHGVDNFPDAEESVSISNYSLSAAAACSRLCHAYESLWNVV
ncbi:Nep1-domain-containing protein [Rozella allomycis CSF55]|uniref:Nep1-domain-containing protein n=1 Tax=Rozella allomycis (strain CSF55) TaxID=988480 RepID=A0A4P9YBR6_ROZAC|nr:Nep1-domain-containing protein [Rozella allomycis CSF55]